MKNKAFMSMLFSLLFVAGNSSGQDSLSHEIVFPKGVSIEYGLGSYSVRDEYISKERYSGTLPYFAINWSQFHSKYGFHLGLEYRGSSKIKNYNVSAEIKQFSLNLDYLYFTGKFSLFSKDAYAFFGPGVELYIYYNKQNIATHGINFSLSLATLFSLSANSEIIVPLGDDFQVEASMNLSLLSLGMRIVDIEAEDESPLKFLTALTGINSKIGIGVRYCLFNHLSVKLAYRLSVTRVSAWDPLLSASNDLIATLTYGF